MTGLLALLRPLLLAVAALVLACTGGVELAPRAPGPPAAATAVSLGVAATQPAARTDAPAPAKVSRASLAPAAAPAAAGAALAPADRLVLAVHLVGAPQARPPTGPAARTASGLPEGRAPPLTTGT